jgi:hypothetical protein
VAEGNGGQHATQEHCAGQEEGKPEAQTGGWNGRTPSLRVAICIRLTRGFWLTTSLDHNQLLPQHGQSLCCSMHVCAPHT